MKATPEAIELMGKLQELSLSGPIPAIGHGATTVGMTLLEALGIEYKSTSKPNYKGVVVTARRGDKNIRTNRVNLFAKVPNWKLSACTSSAEILDSYGYAAKDGRRKLYCTLSAKRPNTQGLMLKVDSASDTLCEVFVEGSTERDVATWEMSELRAKLTQAHPESIWVSARSQEINGREHFHYFYAVHTGSPLVDELDNLIHEGTVTVDHLIDRREKRVSEKGPLFKIDPINFELLFGLPLKIDLMSSNLSETYKNQ